MSLVLANTLRVNHEAHDYDRLEMKQREEVMTVG